MKTATSVICAVLVDALIGAWITHFSEGSQFRSLEHELTSLKSEQVDRSQMIVELGKRLNLCLVERVDDRAKLAEGTKCQK
jgi:hypothetical protein